MHNAFEKVIRHFQVGYTVENFLPDKKGQNQPIIFPPKNSRVLGAVIFLYHCVILTITSSYTPNGRAKHHTLGFLFTTVYFVNTIKTLLSALYFLTGAYVAIYLTPGLNVYYQIFTIC